MNKLVTIIAPCYNGAKYVRPFLDSVLAQTYDNIELIVVNDGSTDETQKILNEYRSKFSNKGYSYTILYQENSGQAAAINRGLEIFNGEYLTWIDSDDVMLNDNIAEKVDFLEKNTEYDFVLSQGVLVDCKDYNNEIQVIKRVHDGLKDNLFYDLINENNVLYGPGSILLKKEALKSAIPTKRIFESPEGQNWQLMLPLAYECKCGYIDKPLFKCVAHEDSHSRNKRTYDEIITRYDNFEVLIKSTISSIPSMPPNEKEKWLLRIEEKYLRKKLALNYQNFKFKMAKENIKALKNIGCYTLKDNFIIFTLKRIFKKLKGLISND